MSYKQGSEQEFKPMKVLYQENMVNALNNLKYWTDPIQEDDKQPKTRLNKQRHADFLEWHKKTALYMVPSINLFIEALPVMLADAKNNGYGPDETFIIRGSYGCNCVEKSGFCPGHTFDYPHYFWSWTEENATCPPSPSSPDSFETQEP